MASVGVAGKNPHRQGGITRLLEMTRGAYLAEMSKTLINRIDSRLKILGMSGEDASKKAGMHRDTIRDLRRGKRKSLTTPHLVALAKALDTTVNWLLDIDEDVPEEQPSFGVKFGGIVEAGAFRRQNLMLEEIEHVLIPMVPDARFPADKQYCFKVVGDSMDKAKIFEGMYVVGIELTTWERLFGEPRDGKLVVVSRQLNGDPTMELTVKRLRIFTNRVELHPESSNPEHQPIVFKMPPDPSDSQHVEIKAVVLNSTWLYE